MGIARKLIIEVRGKIPPVVALSYIQTVIQRGRISNNEKQYGYATKFVDGTIVTSSLNKCSDRFVVYRE